MVESPTGLGWGGGPSKVPTVMMMMEITTNRRYSSEQPFEVGSSLSAEDIKAAH